MAMTEPRSSYTVDLLSSMDLVSSIGLRPLAQTQKSSTYDNLSKYQKRSDADDYDWLSVGEPSTPMADGEIEAMSPAFAFSSSTPYTLSVSTSALFSSEGSLLEGRSRSDEGTPDRGCMSGTDYAIYNSLGADSSRHRGKPTFSQLCLGRGSQKTGIMSKTGPNPSYLCKWNRRTFVLKGNFLFYFSCTDKPLQSARVLGAIYLKGAIIEKTSLSFAKRVLKITPPVPRRVGWEKTRTAAFHIKFRSDRGMNEWLQELQRVADGQQEHLSL